MNQQIFLIALAEIVLIGFCIIMGIGIAKAERKKANGNNTNSD